MGIKNRLIILTLIINSISFGARYNAELTVTGEDVLERIEGTVCNSPNGEFQIDPQTGEEQPIDHKLKDGKEPTREAVWIEDKGTVHNIGKIISNKHIYQTQFGSILGIGGINNPLQKKDNLVYLNGQSKLINDGLVEMGGVDQKIENVLEVADLGFYRLYTEYTKNVINSNNSSIYNRGIIKAKGDDPTYLTALSVSLLKYNDIKLWKNVLNLKNSILENDGEIVYDRDLNIEFTKGVSVGLLGLGVHYEREVAGVLATVAKSNIKNNGSIFIGGDVLRHDTYDGITVDALGLDFEGNHNKYGIKAEGATVTNTGLISIERNFSYGKDRNGNILKVELIYDGFLELGLLSFKNYNEKSIGVSIDSGTFKNNGGHIEVGVNHKDRLLQIYENAAIAVQANNSHVVFNETGRERSTVVLDGSQVWLGELNNGSQMELNGVTDIIFRTENKYGNQVGDPEIIVNNDIFGNDGSGNYIINGRVNILGEKLVYRKEPVPGETDKFVSILDRKEEFAKDITIGEGSNIDIGVDFKTVLDENGNVVRDEAGNIVTENNKLGQLEVNGKLEINDVVDVTSEKLIGEDLNKYIGNTIIIAKGGITGENNIQSNSFLFDLTTSVNPNKTEIKVSDIKRKRFNEIVKNRQLGEIFETTYENANNEQLQVYKIMAQGRDEKQFKNIVDEVTGKDTLITLPAQIYDITRDLNNQFRDFAINNSSDGIVFKYINSESELESDSSTVGFERESSGIMVGYNNNISDKLRIGTGFAYMQSDIDYTSNSKNKVTTWNIRGYSDYDLGFAKVFNDLSFGYNQSENKRIAEQLAYTGVKEGDLDIYSLSLNNSLYKKYKINDKLSITPSLNLDFTYIYQEDFKENGSLGASADKIDTYYVTTGIGAIGKYNLLSYENSKIDLVGGIDYNYDAFRSDEDMKLKVSAFNPYYKEKLKELDKKSLDLNIGLDYTYKDRYSVGINYTKELINDVENQQIGVDFTYKF